VKRLTCKKAKDSIGRGPGHLPKKVKWGIQEDLGGLTKGRERIRDRKRRVHCGR